MDTTCAWKLMLLVLVCIIYTCSSHSFLVKPEADWRSKYRAHCRRGGPESNKSIKDNCRGPCISKKSWFYNENAAHTVWQRGSHQVLEWARNNHRTGFVRFTLVPVKKRRSKKAHTKYTFHFACFEVNKKPCSAGVNGTFCGTDRWLYSTNVRVPDYIGDGEYVLGWSWYGAYAGASKGSTETFHFGDYWSCAYITLKGGAEVVKRSKRNRVPSFDHGGKGRCSAMTNKLGVCKVEPCPDKFRGQSPKLWCPRGSKWKDGRCQFRSERRRSKRRSKNSTVKKSKRKSKKWLKVQLKKRKEEKRAKCWCAKKKKSTSESPRISALVVVGLNKNGGPSWSSTDCVCSGDKINIAKYDYGLTLMAFVYGYHPKEIKFYVDGKPVQTENDHPYTIAGNGGWKFNRYYPPLSQNTEFEAKIEPDGESFTVEDVEFVDE